MFSCKISVLVALSKKIKKEVKITENCIDLYCPNVQTWDHFINRKLSLFAFKFDHIWVVGGRLSFS